MRKFLSFLLIICMLATTFAVIPKKVVIAAQRFNISTYNGLISAIDSSSDGDTIDIASDITITAEVAVTKGITINGNGHTLSVPVPGLDEGGKLAANPSTWRVFNFNANGKTIAINNMAIKGGQPNSMGAAIMNNGGTTLKLTEVSISNSGGTSCAGGGIYNLSRGTIYLKGCNISRNGAIYGGGFLNIGTMFIEESTLSENRSLSGGGGGGAGENQGTLYVNNSTFANNISTELGSAINNYNGKIYVLNSSFVGNISNTTITTLDGCVIRSNNTAEVINCVFAYNYLTKDDGNTYTLADFSAFSNLKLYNSIYQQSSLPAGVTNVVGNTQYTGPQDGMSNTISAGGSTIKLVDANGIQMGTGTIFQPYLVKQDISKPPVISLKSDSFAYNKAIETAFETGANPIVAYKNSSGEWVYIIGTSDADSNIVTTDQLGHTISTTSGGNNAIGSTIVNASNLVMLKVLATAGGSVFGGSLYGDVYPSGTSVTITASPNNGQKFTNWTQTINGVTTTVNNNPYTITLNANTDLTPNYAADTGYTVTYNGNGNTGGIVPSPTYSSDKANPVILSSNNGNLIKTGYYFIGWNTAADGSGTTCNVGDTINFGTNTVLYAKWMEVANSIDINFNSNIDPNTATIKLNNIAGNAMTNQDFDVYMDEVKVNTTPYNTGSSASYLYTITSNLTAGNHILKAIAVVGGATNSSTFAVKPHITANYGGVSYPDNTLTNKDVIFTSTDTNLEYSTNGTSFTAFNSPMTVSTSAEYTFRYIGATDSSTYVTFKTNIDNITPTINIDSIKTDGKDYSYSGTIPTEKDVTFTLSNPNNVISSVTYYYSKDNGNTWTSITGNTFAVSDTNNATVNYKFKAVSGSGLEAETVNYPVYIVKPSFDNINNPIVVTAKASDNADYQGTWTNKNVTYTLTGGINSEAFLKYEYSTDGTAWTDMNGTNKDTLTISSDTDKIYYFRAVAKGLSVSAVTTGSILKIDKTAPTNAKITVKDREFTSFLNTVTFGIFFNKTVNVSITSDSNISGVAKIEYQKVASDADYKEHGTWTTGNSFNVSPDEKFIVYASITDNSGNYVIINSDGVVLDSTKPVISGADADISYFIGRIINLSDSFGEINKATYKIGNDDEVEFNSGDLLYKPGAYTLTLTDKAGNVETKTFNIENLPEVKDVVYTNICKELIEKIRTEFDNHTDLPESYKIDTDNKIKELEKRYSDLDKEVKDKISETSDFKNIIEKLPSGKDGLIAKEEGAKKILSEIDKLTNEQKSSLKEQIDYLNSLLDEINILKTQVETVKTDINNLPVPDKVTKENSEKIGAVNQAYNNLINEQKGLVGTNLVEKLNNVLIALSKIMLHDDPTDVSVLGIDGTTFSSDVYLVVKPINSTENADKLGISKEKVKIAASSIEEIKGKELVALYDVSLFRNNEKIQPDGRVKVKIKIPQNLLSRNGLDIVHIADDGAVTPMKATVEGEYLTFVTAHFSEYAIVASPVANEIPKTGSAVDCTTLLVFGALLSILGIASLRKRQRRGI